MTRCLIAWSLGSVVFATWWALTARALVRGACPKTPSLDERLAPHVLTETDVRVGWVGFSHDRWPAA